MMTETPQIIVRRRQGETPVVKEFKFTAGQVRADGLSEKIAEYRRQAWETSRTLKIPTTKDEAWRRTDLHTLPVDALQFPENGASVESANIPNELLKPLTAEAHGGQVVLFPGGAQVNLNAALGESGVVFTDLLTAEKEHPQIVEKILGKVVKPQEGKFAAMAGALAQNGVVLYVPRGVTVEQPLHSLIWEPGANLAFFSHLLIYLEDGASVTYVHEAASPNDGSGQSMHAGNVEIFVGSGASLRFVELQSWGENIWNFSHERVNVERDGTVDWIFGAVGSHLTKNFSEINLLGEGANGRMSGFYFTDHDQHLDHDTQQNHLAPHTTSDLLFKGALVDTSRSVWQGMIYVAPGAEKTDGYQANRNLVLSRGARADSLPGLEILADDVRCTHGATVGKIDPDLTFYLMSRGISKVEAERLIVEGFFDQIMQRIPFEGVRARFQAAIHEKMKAYSG